jgi:WD40 repeat protein
LGVYAIAEGPDGTVLTAGGDGIINHWSPEFQLLRSVKFSSKKIRSIAQANNQLYVCSGDGVLITVNLCDFSIVNTLRHEQGSVNCVLQTPAGLLITAGWDGHLWLWDSQANIKRVPAHNYAVYSMVPLANGRYFATASRDKTIKIWDAETLDFCARIDYKIHDAHRYSVNCLHFDHESGLLFSGSDDRKIIAWEIGV